MYWMCHPYNSPCHLLIFGILIVYPVFQWVYCDSLFLQLGISFISRTKVRLTIGKPWNRLLQAWWVSHSFTINIFLLILCIIRFLIVSKSKWKPYTEISLCSRKIRGAKDLMSWGGRDFQGDRVFYHPYGGPGFYLTPVRNMEYIKIPLLSKKNCHFVF